MTYKSPNTPKRITPHQNRSMATVALRYSNPLSDKSKKAIAQTVSNYPTISICQSRRRLNASTSITLNTDQQRVIDAVLAGQSLFFTGAAGTGKTAVLNRLVGLLPATSTAITATTGVAACHIGGTTLHAWAGIGDGRATIDQCIQMALRPKVDIIGVLRGTCRLRLPGVNVRIWSSMNVP